MPSLQYREGNWPDGVGGELAELFAGKALLRMGEEEFISKIGAEEGGVVGIDSYQKVLIEVAAEGMGGEGGTDAGADIGCWIEFHHRAPQL